jgi:hypothetical protein
MPRFKGHGHLGHALQLAVCGPILTLFRLSMNWQR